MESININIALALILIIPFHGIFLSIFFFIKSEWSLNPVFYLGLLLFVLSSLTLFQLTYLQYTYLQYKYISLNIFNHYFLYDLLISPFLFLYNSVMIKPDEPVRIYLHLLIITLNFLLFFLMGIISVPVYFVIVVIFIIINGLYLAGSIRLLIDLIKIADCGCKHLVIPEYSGIIVFNLLVSANIIASIFYKIYPVNTIYLALVLKALVIYYIYYRILNKANFPNYYK
jgi:hypothetical protein